MLSMQQLHTMGVLVEARWNVGVHTVSRASRMWRGGCNQVVAVMMLQCCADTPWPCSSGRQEAGTAGQLGAGTCKQGAVCAAILLPLACGPCQWRRGQGHACTAGCMVSAHCNMADRPRQASCICRSDGYPPAQQRPCFLLCCRR